jgi:hypothetical protein
VPQHTAVSLRLTDRLLILFKEAMPPNCLRQSLKKKKEKPAADSRRLSAICCGTAERRCTPSLLNCQTWLVHS